MKKSLLLMMAVALCASLSAQTKMPVKKIIPAAAESCFNPVYGATDEVDPNFVPTQRQSRLTPINSEMLSPIGETYYVTVTNAFARNTINWAPDGSTCATTWTIGSADQKRGTAINYFDLNSQSWAPLPSTDPLDRIEKDPMGAPGWGTHVYTENGECIVSHSTADGGMIINYREKRGEGEWQQSVLKGPVSSNGTLTSTAILWPTLCAVGNTIHMVCVTNNADGYLYNGINQCPVYTKSTDGGKTWESFRDFNGLMTPHEQQEVTADDYVLTARGNHIVLAYGVGFVAYLESKDGGNTWTRTLVYDCNWDWTSTGRWIVPCMYASTSAVAIDDDDIVHIAFGTQMRFRKPDSKPNSYTTWRIFAGMYTWKEGQPLMHDTDMNIVYDTIAEKLISFKYDELPNYMDAPDILGFSKFYLQGDTVDYTWIDYKGASNQAYRSPGYVSHPRLIAHGGKVYLMYSAIIEQPLIYKPVEDPYFYRGVFLTVSHDNGDTFDQKKNTSWLSYHPDLFFCDWSQYEGPVMETPDSIEYKGDITLINYSENGFPSMAMDIQNDCLVFTWLNNYFPGNPSAFAPDAFMVYSFILKTDQAGVYNNTDEVWRNMWNSVSEYTKPVITPKIYPNPANNFATVKVDTESPYTLTVTNMMGQVVYTQKCQQSKTDLNVSNFAPGIYIVNVRTAHAMGSQKLIVR